MLDALARGLRVAGGVLSPGVYQGNVESDLLAQRGAQAAALQANELAARTADRADARAFQAQNIAENRAARVADLNARMEASQQELMVRHKQRLEELALRQADMRERAAADQQFRREMAELQIAGRREFAQLAASLRAPVQPPAPSPVTIADPNDPNKAIVIDARTQGKIGDAPPKAAAEKALPTSAAQKLFENQQNLRRAQQALTLVEQNPDATGVKGFMPDAVLQRVAPGGVDARAAIGDLGSLVIHDRSGAAVTAAEFPRLRPFIPLITDSADTVKKKLNRFVSEYQKVVQETSDFYKESGYKVPTGALQPSGATPGASGGWGIRKLP